MDTEACIDGTSDLGLFLMVSLFIGFFGVGITRRWASRWAQPTGACLGPPGAPRCLVPYSFTLWSFHEALGVSFVLKKLSKSLSSFGELSFMHKEQHHDSSAE